MSTLKELNEIMGFLDSGAIERFYPDDEINFDCQRCNKCCKNSDILLTPYDVAKLRSNLKINTATLLDKYCVKFDRTEGPVVPGIMLKRAITNGCPFLLNSGCSVYKDRPGMCRNYPLMKITQKGPEEKGFELLGLSSDEYFIFHPSAEDCPGCLVKGTQTIQQLLKQNETAEYEKHSGWLMELFQKFDSIEDYELTITEKDQLGETMFNFDVSIPVFAKQAGGIPPKTDIEIFALIETAVYMVIEDIKKTHEGT
jgi:Fe-S-cluster containining protein